MSKIRIHVFSKELGLTNAELIELLQAEGCEVKSASSSIEEEIAAIVKEKVFAQRRDAAAKPAAAPVAPAPAPAAPAPKTFSRRPAAAAPAPAVLKDLEAVLNLSGKKSVAVPAAPASKATARPVAAAAAAAAAPAEAPKTPPKELHFKGAVTVRELAEAICRKPNELVAELMMMNVFATINQPVEIDIIEKICQRHGIHFIRERRNVAARAKLRPEGDAAAEEDKGNQVPRPPVIVFMGHVDHGKTSLQDAIRQTEVAAGERGGITQSIGASVVNWNGHSITMIDTPGHEAFTSMRARGASTTDIAILVVAADDGAMPQTIEALQHAREAKVPIIVAMNKMDLPGADPDRVKVSLQKEGVNAEDWGGDVAVVPVSAVTREGLDDLLERIVLEAEMLEIKGNPDLPARGLVLEAQLETGMGPTANVLVRNGTLHAGDLLVCGRCYGRVKAMIDYHGKRVKSAGPSTPVKIMGLSGVPEAGDLLEIFADEKSARAVVEDREIELKKIVSASRVPSTVEEMFVKMSAGTKVEFKVLIKTDVRGSLEAIQASLKKIQSEKIQLTVISGGVGEISENDVQLASTSKSMILGFNVRAMPNVKAVARREDVEIRLYGIIYELLDDVQNILLGRLKPETRENRTGKAEIIQVFTLSKNAGKVCGSRVTDGMVRVGAIATVSRGKDVIYKGRIHSLRRFQEDVKEVKSGLECGIRMDNFEDFVEGDTIEVFTVEKLAATL